MVTLYAAGEQAGAVADPVKPVPEPAADPRADDVFAFCRDRAVGEHLRKAVELAREAFAPVERLEAEVRRDPATDDEWVVLRVVVRADRVNVPAARKRYTAGWVASVPAPQRYLIRLSPDVL